MKISDVRLVIFDLDGTLVNAYPAIIESFNYAMRAGGYPVQAPGIIRAAVGWGDKNLIAPFVRARDLKRVLAAYRRHHRESLRRKSRLLKGARSVLARLKRKSIKLAVASNRPTRFARILIRHLKIAGYFDYVLCSDRLKNIKPHPEILRNIMRRLKTGPRHTVFVGDMVIDAQAGKRARVKTIIVSTGSSSRAAIARVKPYAVIRSLAELSALL
ncbi:MAG: HAD family hydrolase [Candidatus Omnitrophica bacterium]|nr:HAD family hydrolase [Candidatus Omnitrophota bacterium]